VLIILQSVAKLGFLQSPGKKRIATHL